MFKVIKWMRFFPGNMHRKKSRLKIQNMEGRKRRRPQLRRPKNDPRDDSDVGGELKGLWMYKLKALQLRYKQVKKTEI